MLFNSFHFNPQDLQNLNLSARVRMLFMTGRECTREKEGIKFTYTHTQRRSSFYRFLDFDCLLLFPVVSASSEQKQRSSGLQLEKKQRFFFFHSLLRKR